MILNQRLDAAEILFSKLEILSQQSLALLRNKIAYVSQNNHLLSNITFYTHRTIPRIKVLDPVFFHKIPIDFSFSETSQYCSSGEKEYDGLSHSSKLNDRDREYPLMTPKIDILKNQMHAIPELSKLWIERLGRWSTDTTLREVESWMYEWLNDDMPLAFVALVENKPVGMCSLQFNDGIRPNLKPWLGDLCVNQAYQNRGIGRLLIDATKKKARESGFKKLYLFAPDPDIPAYYESLGWIVIGSDYYHGNHVIVMETTLENIS